MGKIQRTFHKEFVAKGLCFRDDRDAYITLHNIYNRYLKETRNDVCRFYNIKSTEDLSLKVMLRMYYFYIPKNDYCRAMMDLINFQVNYILDRISIGYVFPVYLDDGHELNYKKPIDVRI